MTGKKKEEKETQRRRDGEIKKNESEKEIGSKERWRPERRERKLCCRQREMCWEEREK